MTGSNPWKEKHCVNPHHKYDNFHKWNLKGSPHRLMVVMEQLGQPPQSRSIQSLSQVHTLYREGGILSPFLFNLYMDELSCRLNKCNIGCMCGDLCVNHLMYADDLVVFCPYSGGIQTLLKICTEYGYGFDIKYNQK